MAFEYIHKLLPIFCKTSAYILLTGETNEIDHRFKFVGICGLYILHFQLFRVTDKKVFKSLWDMYKKVINCSAVSSFFFFV